MDRLLKDIDFQWIKRSTKPVKQLTVDSRKVTENSLFCAISGLTFDGHDFAYEALLKGASFIILEKDIKLPPTIDANIIKVSNSKKTLALVARNFYDDPASNLKIIGITGTNGKTSTTYYIESILKKVGKTGVIGTMGATIDQRDIGVSYATSTTPDSIELYQILHEMVLQNVKYLVMEVSSHALYLEKMYKLPLEVAVFTNLTQDHLDFHEDMHAYQQAKLKIFDTATYGLINIDDEAGPSFFERATNTVINQAFTLSVASTGKTGKNNIDFMAQDPVFTVNGSTFDVCYPEKRYPFTLHVPGDFSVYNALSAIATCLIMGVSMEICQQGIEEMKGVPGRFESISNDKNIGLIVDYAHTADSLENILKALRPFTKKRSIVVFGCGGDRDKTKRAKMAKTALTYADFSILTSDNPRSEEPMDIIHDMIKGIQDTPASQGKYVLEPDRKKAIQLAIDMAEAFDTIVIAGKGHEKTQETKGIFMPFDDREIAQHFIENKEG